MQEPGTSRPSTAVTKPPTTSRRDLGRSSRRRWQTGRPPRRSNSIPIDLLGTSVVSYALTRLRTRLHRHSHGDADAAVRVASRWVSPAHGRGADDVRQAASDAILVRQLRLARFPTLVTVDQVMAFMEDYDRDFNPGQPTWGFRPS